MRYQTLLLDLDHTLFDSSSCERQSFENALLGAGVDEPLRHFRAYVEINQALWKSVESGALTPQDVRVTRFERLVAAIGLDADPEALADAFALGLGANGELYPGAREVLEELSGRVRLGLVTNGLSEVQRARIERLRIGPLFDAIVISAEVGVAKPAREIFDLAFEALGAPEKNSALMVGDSLTSDIRGGADYGIATCWYNPNGETAGPEARIHHEIVRLDELPDVVAGGSRTSP